MGFIDTIARDLCYIKETFFTFLNCPLQFSGPEFIILSSEPPVTLQLPGSIVVSTNIKNLELIL